ncbi:MAG: thermonuclease family protein [Alphaproteobacteria bacterium]|nr:thermonuclease family protein [Alphaproteobacteria bacterium]
MNKILCALFGIFLSGVAFAVPAVVDYVLDGDTFAAGVKIDDDITITVRVRIINVDTPELNGACDAEIDKANKAKDFVSDLLPVGTVVDLKNIKDDKYLGRIDANVILLDGRDVGDMLIKEKLARPYSGGKRHGWCN